METNVAPFLPPEPIENAPPYRPSFFRLAVRTDSDLLRDIVRADPGIVVSDQLQSQIRELIATRHPERTLPPEDVARLESEFAGDRPSAELGVWVHYPWSRRVVHLLDEADFVELRTSRNRYKITSDEQVALSQVRIGVIGLSVGQSIALTLAIERDFGEIRLADFDCLELSNLNRIRSGVQNLGLPKVVVAAREIAEIDPFLRVTCFPAGVDAGNLDRFLLGGGRLDLVVEESDSIDIKVLARERARALGIPVVMETSDRGMLDIERFDLEPNRPLFHGLTGNLDHRALRGLSFEEKIPHILRITGIETLSLRMKASMIEVGQSIPTWPQLASAVALGGALGADACRRIALNEHCPSGRHVVDLDALATEPCLTAAAPFAPPSNDPTHPPAALSERTMRALIARVDRARPAGSVAPDPDFVADLVAAATLAPSAGNSQPWLWVVTDAGLYLFHDQARASTFLDSAHRASFVALGAATENVVLRAHSLGLDVECLPLPLPNDPRLAAAFRFGAAVHGRGEPRAWASLASAIPHRHTNRKHGSSRPLDAKDTARLHAATASIPGARLHLIEDEGDIAEIADVLGAAERLRFCHRASHHDLMSELRWTAEESAARRDGIDLATLELSETDLAGLRVCRDWAVVDLVRQWGGGKALERMTRRAVEASAAVGLITMPGGGLDHAFAGGRAMERLWLAATQAGIAVQPVSSLPYLFARCVSGDADAELDAITTSVTTLRDRYLRLFAIEDGAAEVFLARFAVASSPSQRALRRPVRDVLRFL